MFYATSKEHEELRAKVRGMGREGDQTNRIYA